VLEAGVDQMAFTRRIDKREFVKIQTAIELENENVVVAMFSDHCK